MFSQCLEIDNSSFRFTLNEFKGWEDLCIIHSSITFVYATECKFKKLYFLADTAAARSFSSSIADYCTGVVL